MSIRCVCPNGHVLNVKDKYAGANGLCPVCQAQVSVPQLPKPSISEDAILEVLGYAEPVGKPETVISSTKDAFSDTSLSGIRRQVTPNKTCDRCHQEVPGGTHICPYCRTYIASLKDF